MQIDLAPNHIALAAPNGSHVGRDGTGRHAKLLAVTGEMSDPRAPNLSLARHAGDIGAGAANPSALHKGGTPPRSRHVPSYKLAPLSAPEDQYVKVFEFRHGFLHELLWLS